MVRAPRLLIALFSLYLSACNSDDDYYNRAPAAGPQANLQVLAASPDAPPFNVLIDGQLAIPNLDYGQGTGEQPYAATTHTITLQAQTPGTPTTVISPTTLDLQANMDYVVVAEGPIATIAPVVFPHTLALVSQASTQVQVLHAAPNAPAVAVYLTAPGADLASSSPLGTFSFQGSLGPTQVPSGSYEIRVTPSGATTPVLFDSGTITLPGGSDLVLAALQNTGPGTAPITLSLLDSYGNNSRIFDVGTPANVRFIHDSPNAPAISVVANGDVTAPWVPTLSYPDFTSYLAETAGLYGVAITPASNASDTLVSQNLQLSAGSVHSVYAIGLLASLNTLVTRDDDRRYATQAKLRIIHGSPAAGPVDIYLTAPSAGISTATPVCAGVPFGGDTGFVSYAAGSYDLTITAAGSKTPAIGPTPVTLSNDGVYTAVARDAAGGGTPLGLILLDDFGS